MPKAAKLFKHLRADKVRLERRLAAILAADVVGYSRLMSADEEGTHFRLLAYRREVIAPKVREHRGRIVKNTGDGALVEFGSVVDAVRCATAWQAAMAGRSEPEESRIAFRHVLPNTLAPLIVLATAQLGSTILTEASLSFLGLGIPEPYPSWGRMLSESAAEYVRTAPWLVIFPGVAISLAVFGTNLFGDALRDILDPRQRG